MSRERSRTLALGLYAMAAGAIGAAVAYALLELATAWAFSRQRETRHARARPRRVPPRPPATPGVGLPETKGGPPPSRRAARRGVTLAELTDLASPPCHECGQPVQRTEWWYVLTPGGEWVPGACAMVCADGHRVPVELLEAANA